MQKKNSKKIKTLTLYHMDRQIIYNIIAGRQLDHCVYKMPPQTINSPILQPLSTDYGSSILTLFYRIHKYS